MVTIVGHRGAADLAPENTVSAVRRAVDAGVDLVEFDVRQTADGHLVVMHDSSVDRTTDGSGAVGELSLSEISALDAGEGQAVPTLEAMLDEIADLGVGAYVELKDAGIADRTVAAARERGVASSSRFTSWDPDFLAPIADRDVRIGGPIDDPDPETLERVADLGYEHVGIHHETLTPEIVDRIHDRGIEVTAWPVNDRATAKRVADHGVDAITSDRPDVVRSALSE